METQSDYLPREPKQERGRAKVAKILKAAEHLVAELGPDGFSSPQVAELADVPVASVYQFFPTRYAILNALKQKHVERLAMRLAPGLEAAHCKSWQNMIGDLIEIAVDYLNEDDVARAVLLERPHYPSPPSSTLNMMPSFSGTMTQFVPPAMLEQITPRDGTISPVRVVLHMMSSIMLEGNAVHGKITPEVADEARIAAITYIEARAALAAH